MPAAAFLPPRTARACRTITWLALWILVHPIAAGAQKFYPDDPLEREPAPLPVDAAPRNFSLLLERVSATFSRRGERHPPGGVIAAQDVNTLGEVLDGAWFVKRHGRARMTLDELRRGSGGEPPAAEGPLRVMLVRDGGLRPFIAARDAFNRLYAFRFDPRDAPELATGADIVTSRLFHALGYHVPETHLVVLDRARLVPDNNASDITSLGQQRDLVPKDIDRFLERAERRRDGKYRAIALRVPTGGATLIGPFQFFGTRSDDPNDIVAHEHRRELRGLHVFSAWVNHTRVSPIQTADVTTQLDGEPPHVRHYLFDFMAALGSGLNGPKPGWEGRDPIYARNTAITNVVTFGLYAPRWMRASYPDLPAVGRLDSKTFEPDKWVPLYDLAPFANRLPDDTFWAARQVMAFSNEDIEAIVQAAEYSDPNAARWIADCLIERRDRIGRTYFDKVLPLVGFAVRDNVFVFEDLATVHGFAGPRPYRIEWSIFDNETAKPSTRIGTADVRTQIPPAVDNAPAGGYVLARITAERGTPGMAVNVYWRKDATGLRVVGIDHEWPGRKLVDPRIVMRPTRNRYVELEPERQKLFETYAQQLNVKSGQSLSAEERFRALSVSEQTTYDGVTHALMHSSMTDDGGRPLGRAIDLLTAMEHIAGQDPGRAGDQQFRLYATLRTDARDTLERSREFARSSDNAVYHAGYPASYRSAGGVPSIQFSLSADGLRADIDVDYRASKAPQSLFNGHLTSSNSDVRAGDNAQRHDRRWNGFVNWWSNLFGDVKFRDRPEAVTEAVGAPATRTPTVLPPNRPLNASIPELADAVQEFLTDWLIRRKYEEAIAFFAPEAFKCVADSVDAAPTLPPDQLRRAGLRLLEESANAWGRPRNLTEAMTPVRPWSPSVRIAEHAFSQDFTIVEAPTELGVQYECGATPPRKFVATATPEYGKYYGALLQVTREGQPGGTIVFVWRRVEGEWRLVSYRAIE
jgi:hypothetical protein